MNFKIPETLRMIPSSLDVMGTANWVPLFPPPAFVEHSCRHRPGSAALVCLQRGLEPLGTKVFCTGAPEKFRVGVESAIFQHARARGEPEPEPGPEPGPEPEPEPEPEPLTCPPPALPHPSISTGRVVCAHASPSKGHPPSRDLYQVFSICLSSIIPSGLGPGPGLCCMPS